MPVSGPESESGPDAGTGGRPSSGPGVAPPRLVASPPAPQRDGELAGDRALLSRTSTAERVADVLRSRIAEGFFPPGTRLSEGNIGGALGVSRNTLRESFRLLTHERLLEHRLNRGVFVRVLTVEDVLDIYRMRKLVECGVVHQLDGAGAPFGLDALAATVAEGEAAVREWRWKDLATANIHFHRELVALARSPRTDEVMGSVLAELRLALHVMDSPRRLHEPYLVRNREILATLRAGEPAKAERMLRRYLDDSRRQIVAAYAQRLGTRDGADRQDDGRPEEVRLDDGRQDEESRDGGPRGGERGNRESRDGRGRDLGGGRGAGAAPGAQPMGSGMGTTS